MRAFDIDEAKMPRILATNGKNHATVHLHTIRKCRQLLHDFYTEAALHINNTLLECLQAKPSPDATHLDMACRVLVRYEPCYYDTDTDLPASQREFSSLQDYCSVSRNLLCRARRVKLDPASPADANALQGLPNSGNHGWLEIFDGF